MKIVMLHVDLPGETKGGVAHQASRLADVLTERGHEVAVVSLSERPPGAKYNLQRVRFPARFRQSRTARFFGMPLAYALRSYGAFDVVHAHGDSQLLFRRRVPVVRTFHGSAREEARHADRLRRKVTQRLLVGAEQLSLHLATATVAVSRNTRRSIGAVDAIIPCGVDRNRFHPGSKSKRPTILFVGTMNGRKRGAAVVEAFREAVQPAFPNAQLWLVADEVVAGDGITSWGVVDDETLGRLYREAWLFTMPSTYEGFGIPYVEAMASGTAVVTTANPGADELVRPESGGIVVDDRGLGSSLVSLLERDALRARLGERGRGFSAQFDWSRVAVAYEEIYELARERVERSEEH